MDNEQYPKYKGVRLRKWGKWVSEIRLPNSRERIWLGSFDSPEKAARAFDAALYCLRGPDAAFNFPENPPEIPGGRSMSPPEIQAAARRFANEQRHGNNQASEEMNSSRGEIDDSGGGPNGPTGEEEAVVNNINATTTTTTMDWSFLSTLETVGVGPAGFGYFHDDVANGFYQQPDGGPDPTPSSFYDGGGNDDSFFGDEDFSNHSFLWNF